MFGVSKITQTTDISMVSFYNVPSDAKSLAKIFTGIGDNATNVDMISQTAPISDTITLSFTIPDKALGLLLEIIAKNKEALPNIKPIFSSNNAKISLYGEDMPKTPGVAAKAVTAIANAGAEIILITTSETDISILVTESDLPNVIASLETMFCI